MKKIFISFLLIYTTAHQTDAQVHVNLKDLKPKTEYENILVEKLSSDTLASCFAIWVKNQRDKTTQTRGEALPLESSEFF